MKRIITLLLTFVVVLSLCACDTIPPEMNKDTYKVGKSALEVMDEQGAGMLTATPRSESIVVSNFKVGGCVRIFNTLDEGYVTTPLNADNFYNYLYGGSTDWTGATDYDGCTYISALPAVTTAE